MHDYFFKANVMSLHTCMNVKDIIGYVLYMIYPVTIDVLRGGFFTSCGIHDPTMGCWRMQSASSLHYKSISDDSRILCMYKV